LTEIIDIPSGASSRMAMIHAETDDQIMRCFPLMKVLRPHLEETKFLAAVRQQQTQGYHLLFVESDGTVKSAAGYRIQAFLAWGKCLYIDDLITLPGATRQGLAGQLLDWLIDHARAEECDSVHLDSGYQRHHAHRLYLNKGFTLNCHHFAIDLRSAESSS
jgi:GNAT superfamily N-acetyltransferase